MISIGRRPDFLRVHLTGGAPFVSELEAVDGTTFEEIPSLHFPLISAEGEAGETIVWNATLESDTLAAWEVSADDVALVIDRSSRAVELFYGDFPWATGRFEVGA